MSGSSTSNCGFPGCGYKLARGVDESAKKRSMHRVPESQKRAVGRLLKMNLEDRSMPLFCSVHFRKDSFVYTNERTLLRRDIPFSKMLLLPESNGTKGSVDSASTSSEYSSESSVRSTSMSLPVNGNDISGHFRRIIASMQSRPVESQVNGTEEKVAKLCKDMEDALKRIQQLETIQNSRLTEVNETSVTAAADLNSSDQARTSQLGARDAELAEANSRIAELQEGIMQMKDNLAAKQYRITELEAQLKAANDDLVTKVSEIKSKQDQYQSILKKHSRLFTAMQLEADHLFQGNNEDADAPPSKRICT